MCHYYILLDSFYTENQEKFYLYIIVSVTAGILIFLGLVIGRLLVSRHRAKRDAKFHANNEALPNGFTDDISEIDADIDLTTPVPVPMQDTRFVTHLITFSNKPIYSFNIMFFICQRFLSIIEILEFWYSNCRVNELFYIYILCILYIMDISLSKFQYN